MSAPRCGASARWSGSESLPIAALAWMFVVGSAGWSALGRLPPRALSRGEAPPSRREPLPAPDTPIGGANFVWPPVAGYLVSPLTSFRSGSRTLSWSLLGLACFALALWLVGVRDWRVYGVVALWPEFTGEMRVSHLTPVLAVLLAAAWRWRDARGAPGVLVGFAVAMKFFVWPLGVWLAATRRWRDTPSGDGCRRRVAAPRAPVHVAARLRARALACSERSSTTRATTSSG